MPANFPTNPTLNQTYTFSGSTWTWSGSTWLLTSTAQVTGATGATGAGVTLTAVASHVIPAANVTYDLGTNSLRWRDLYLSGNSLYIGGATLTATGSAIALPAGSTVGGQSVASGGDVATGGGPKITNLQITSNVYVVLDDTAVDLTGGFVKLTGTNFVSGCLVYVASTPANSTTFVSTTEVRAQLPATAAGTYPVYLVNPDGGTAIRVPGVTFSASPAWQTASNLGEQYDGIVLTLPVVATDATVYTLSSGSLPPGLSLNSNNGVISGTVSGVANDTVYSFTITATDAQLQDSPRTFTVTITVSDPYFKLTTLLLSGSAISANTVVRDSSTNNFNLTVFGDSRASNFTPYGTGWSVYFDGTGDSLSITNTTALQFGTGDFTVEAWVYLTATPGAQYAQIIGRTEYGSNGDWMLQITNTRTLTWYMQGSFVATSTGTILLNTWTQVAATRSGSSIRLFINGTIDGTATNSGSTENTSSGDYTIGADQAADEVNLTGYISNLRVIKGTALYTANFTPATTNLTAVANTSLLTCNANRFLDSSTNNFAITRNGDAAIRSFNPFNITNTGVNGSMYFDGSGDYVSTPSNVALSPVSSAFTLECWFYRPAAQTGNKGLVMAGTANSEPNAVGIYINESQIVGYNANASFNLVYSSGPPLYAWNHVALVRSGTGAGQTKLYLNGIEVASGTFTQTFVSPCPIYIGATVYGVLNNAEYVNAYIADVRFVKGSAVYTANFTPPTQPLTAITNTQLLTLQYDQPYNNHTFLDSSGNQVFITRNGNASQGTFSPFYPGGWSIYFDGSTSYISAADSPILQLSTGDFTIECWVNIPSTSAQTFITKWTASGTGYYLGLSASNTIGFYTTAVSGGITASFTITNQWVHIAGVRSGNTYLLYVNGSSVGTPVTTTASNADGGSVLNIGRNSGNSSNYTSGYISNARIVKGTAVYTGNFTPPAVPLTVTANTQFLVGQDNRFINRAETNYGQFRYWRYVEGAAVTGHHPRVSRIMLIDDTGASNTIITYVADNCVDSGTYLVGTVTYDFGVGNSKRILSVQAYHVTTAGRAANYTVQYSSDNTNWITAFSGVMTSVVCGLITGSISSTITRNGDARISAFSPFAPPAVYSPVVHGGSAYFDGSGDTLTVSQSLVNTLTTMTIEGWFYINSSATYQGLWGGGVDLYGINLQYQETANQKLHLFIGSGGAWSTGNVSNTSLVPYTWYHIAYVRSGTTHWLYINGAVDSSINGVTNSVTWSGSTFYIGVPQLTTRYYNGYVANFRISNSRRYSADFTPPTGLLSSDANTIFLLNGSDAAIIDSTGRQVFETVADAKSSGVVTKFTGGSISFDGTGDALRFIQSPYWNITSTTTHTIEAWVYHTGTTSKIICSNYWYQDGSSEYGWVFQILNTSSVLRFVSAAASSVVASTTAVPTGVWAHVAATIVNLNVTFYINGVNAGGGGTVSSINYTNTIPSVGAAYSNGGFNSGPFVGYINDLRITQGYARYTANFTTPTAPARLK